MNPANRPIGVFDSGVGGLTVLRALLAELPDERFVYLGDTARVPYGSKSPDTVARYSLNIADELIARDCKAIVIACNTASAYAREAVAAHTDVPVFDVITPVAREVVASTEGPIAVLGTRGTVASHAYRDAIQRLDPQRVVLEQPCPLFVPLAEEGWLEGDVPRRVADRYLRELMERDTRPTAWILGCTHYPLLRDVIAEATTFQDNAARLFESGDATAAEVREKLANTRLLRSDAGRDSHQWLVTDDPRGFEAVALRFLGSQNVTAEHVDLGTGAGGKNTQNHA